MKKFVIAIVGVALVITSVVFVFTIAGKNLYNDTYRMDGVYGTYSIDYNTITE